MNNRLSYEEYQTIMNSLVEHHAVFYQFWRLVKPQYSEEIDTACVSFNKEGRCIDFLINPTYWASVDDLRKKFIICHECMHVLNSHGKRIGTKFSEYGDQANIAMDIVVNEGLTKFFGFNRNKIDPDDEYIWLDKVFKDDPSVVADNSFEYYLNKLIENNVGPAPSKSLVNQHSGLGIPDELVQEIINQLSDEEGEVLKNIAERSEQGKKKDNGQIAGKSGGQLTKKLDKKPTVFKSKWETIIKKFEKSFGKEETSEAHWIAKDRRMFNLNFDMFLPSDIEHEVRKTEKEKIKTYFLMDSSGSCQNLAQRFFDAAKSINPNKFDVEYYCFDTEVYKVDIAKRKLFGFGGTSFKSVSDFIYKKNKVKPSVWILTDGHGDYPDIPESEEKKWSWFLIEGGSKRFVPQNSKIYNLENFE